MQRNIFGEEIVTCSTAPLTGYTRNGCCDFHNNDLGQHTVCAVMTEEFLRFSFDKGNDLITPHPEWGFEGLGPGDKWCLCALRWKEALEQNVAPLVVLEATHESVLEIVDYSDLIKYAYKK